MEEKHGLKDYFVTGMFAILPLAISIALTIWILELLWESFFSAFVPGVQAIFREFFAPETVVIFERWRLHQALGLLLLLLVIVSVGFVARHFIGKSLLKLLDRVVNAIP